MYFRSADGAAWQEDSLVCYQVRVEVNLGVDDVRTHFIGCKSAPGVAYRTVIHIPD